MNWFPGVLYSSLKSTVLVLLVLVLVLSLIFLMVGINSGLGRCGSRVCRHSFLNMLFGQNLRYTHTGQVPI